MKNTITAIMVRICMMKLLYLQKELSRYLVRKRGDPSMAGNCFSCVVASLRANNGRQ
jgi:hypothetical protein